MQISFKLIPNVSVQVRSISLLNCIGGVVSDLGFLNLFCYDNTKTKTTTFTNTKGEVQTSMLTVWTEKGRKFIHDIINTLN